MKSEKIETELCNNSEACISLIKEDGVYALSMYSSFDKENAYAVWFRKEGLLELISKIESLMK
jgi:hypothetical protein